MHLGIFLRWKNLPFLASTCRYAAIVLVGISAKIYLVLLGSLLLLQLLNQISVFSDSPCRPGHGFALAYFIQDSPTDNFWDVFSAAILTLRHQPLFSPIHLRVS